MCGRCVDNCCVSRAIVSVAEVVCAARRGWSMGTNVSRGCGRGLSCRGLSYRGLSCWWLLFRCYRVGDYGFGGRRVDVHGVEAIVLGAVGVGATVR